jgi:hypothetical protein
VINLCVIVLPINEEGRVPDSIIGDFSILYTYIMPVSSPAEVYVEFQGIFFPNRHLAMRIFTRVASLTRISEHASLAMHVPNIHRWLYDRAEHMLNYYGGDERYRAEITICEQTMALIDRYFNYPARNREEILEYASDAEDGLERRMPNPIPQQPFTFTGANHTATPQQSRVALNRAHDDAILDTTLQRAITDRQVILTATERRDVINEMVFLPQNDFGFIPYLNEDASDSNSSSSITLVSNTNYTSDDLPNSFTRFEDEEAAVPADHLTEVIRRAVINRHFQRERVLSMGLMRGTVDSNYVHLPRDGSAPHYFYEYYGTRAGDLSTATGIGSHEIVTDAIRAVVEAHERGVRIEHVRVPNDLVTLQREYGHVAHAIAREFNILLNEVITDDLRERITARLPYLQQNRQPRTYREIYGDRAEGVARLFAVNIDSEVGQAVLDHTRTVLAMYGQSAERVCRHYRLEMFDIVSHELEQRISRARLPDLVTPTTTYAVDRFQPGTMHSVYGSRAMELCQRYGLRMNEIVTTHLRLNVLPLNNTQEPAIVNAEVGDTPTVYSEYGVRARAICTTLELAMDAPLTPELRTRIDSIHDLPLRRFSVRQYYGEDSPFICSYYSIRPDALQTEQLRRAIITRGIPTRPYLHDRIVPSASLRYRRTVRQVYYNQARTVCDYFGLGMDDIVTMQIGARIDLVGIPAFGWVLESFREHVPATTPTFAPTISAPRTIYEVFGEHAGVVCYVHGYALNQYVTLEIITRANNIPHRDVLDPARRIIRDQYCNVALMVTHYFGYELDTIVTDEIEERIALVGIPAYGWNGQPRNPDIPDAPTFAPRSGCARTVYTEYGPRTSELCHLHSLARNQYVTDELRELIDSTHRNTVAAEYGNRHLRVMSYYGVEATTIVTYELKSLIQRVGIPEYPFCEYSPRHRDVVRGVDLPQYDPSRPDAARFALDRYTTGTMHSMYFDRANRLCNLLGLGLNQYVTDEIHSRVEEHISNDPPLPTVIEKYRFNSEMVCRYYQVDEDDLMTPELETRVRVVGIPELGRFVPTPTVTPMPPYDPNTPDVRTFRYSRYDPGTVASVYPHRTNTIFNQLGFAVNQIVTDEMRSIIASRLTPGNTVSEEYPRRTHAVCEHYGLNEETIVTDEIRARIRLVGIPEGDLVGPQRPSDEDMIFGREIPPYDPDTPDVPTFAEDRNAPGTMASEYGRRSYRIYKRLGIAYNQYVTDEMRARIAVLPDRDPPHDSLMDYRTAYGEDGAAMARVNDCNIRNRVPMENGRPISRFTFGQRHMLRPYNPRRTLIDVYGGFAFDVARQLGVEIDHVMSPEELARHDADLEQITNEVEEGDDDDDDEDKENVPPSIIIRHLPRRNQDPDGDGAAGPSHHQSSQNSNTQGTSSSDGAGASSHHQSSQNIAGGSSHHQSSQNSNTQGTSSQRSTASERPTKRTYFDSNSYSGGSSSDESEDEEENTPELLRLKKHTTHPWFSMDIHTIYALIVMQLLCNKLANKISVRELARREPKFIERIRNSSLTRNDIASVRGYARSHRLQHKQVVGIFSSRLSENYLGFFYIYDPCSEDVSDSQILRLLYAACQAVQLTFLQHNQKICSSVFWYGPTAPDARQTLYRLLNRSLDAPDCPTIRFPLEEAVFDRNSPYSFLRYREPLMVPLKPECPPNKRRRETQ